VLDFGSTAQLAWIFGSLQSAEEKKALEARLLSLAQISLCLEITRLPLLHSSAWQMNAELLLAAVALDW
jgi:hypothetical protein